MTDSLLIILLISVPIIVPILVVIFSSKKDNMCLNCGCRTVYRTGRGEDTLYYKCSVCGTRHHKTWEFGLLKLGPGVRQSKVDVKL